MLFGKAAQAAKVIAVRETVIPFLHRQLGLMARVHPLPGEFPPLPRDQKAAQSLVKFAEKLLCNDDWWKAAPELYPLSEDHIESILEATKHPEFDNLSREQKDHMEEIARTEGLSKQAVKGRLKLILNTYKTGSLPKI